MKRATVVDVPTLLLTPEQAAAACQVSRGKLDEWTHRAGFPVIRDNGTVRIHLELLKKWLEDQALPAPKASPSFLPEYPQLIPPARQRAR